jgi:hypothetical protein
VHVHPLGSMELRPLKPVVSRHRRGLYKTAAGEEMNTNHFTT